MNDSWIVQMVEWMISNWGSHGFNFHLFQDKVTTKNLQPIGCAFMIDDQRNNSEDARSSQLGVEVA